MDQVSLVRGAATPPFLCRRAEQEDVIPIAYEARGRVSELA